MTATTLATASTPSAEDRLAVDVAIETSASRPMLGGGFEVLVSISRLHLQASVKGWRGSNIGDNHHLRQFWRSHHNRLDNAAVSRTEPAEPSARSTLSSSSLSSGTQRSEAAVNVSMRTRKSQQEGPDRF